MAFNVEDRVRELERELQEIRAQLGRLPTRHAMPRLPFSIIRCQAKGAASGATFTVDQIVLVDGIDPRADPTDLAEELTVTNPAGLSFDDDAHITCVYSVDAGEWWPVSGVGEKGDPGDPGPAGPPGADGEVGYTAGCGIAIGEGNVLSVDAADLAGPGLVVTTGCELAVNPGCGIAVNIDDEVVIDESIFGAGLVFSSSECTVEVVLAAGCGITVDGHEVSVDATDLVGVNGGLQTSGTCGLAVKPDCGIEVGAGGVKVKASDLVGVDGGLETSGTCGLAVKPGCGITVDSEGVAVLPSELAGRGLIESPEGGDCLIDIDHNCSLEIPATGGYANKLKIHEDFPDSVNGGLEWTNDDPDTGQCKIKVKHDCTLQIENGDLGIERDIAGQYLVWTDSSCGAQAKLNVFRSLTSWITDITFFGIEGDTLVIKYARNWGYVLEQTSTQFVEKRVPLVDPCEIV